MALSAIVSLLGHLSQALQQLGLGSHHLSEVRRWQWWSLLLTVVAGSMSLLRCSFNFSFGLRLGLRSPILMLSGSWWSCGSASASSDGGGRCLALSLASSCRSSTASSACCGDDFFLSGFLEAVHQAVGLSDGHLLNIDKKKTSLALGVRLIIWSIQYY